MRGRRQRSRKFHVIEWTWRCTSTHSAHAWRIRGFPLRRNATTKTGNHRLTRRSQRRRQPSPAATEPWRHWTQRARFRSPEVGIRRNKDDAGLLQRRCRGRRRRSRVRSLSTWPLTTENGERIAMLLRLARTELLRGDRRREVRRSESSSLTYSALTYSVFIASADSLLIDRSYSAPPPRDRLCSWPAHLPVNHSRPPGRLMHPGGVSVNATPPYCIVPRGAIALHCVLVYTD